jgi:hypothetical protein
MGWWAINLLWGLCGEASVHGRNEGRKALPSPIASASGMLHSLPLTHHSPLPVLHAIARWQQLESARCSPLGGTSREPCSSNKLNGYASWRIGRNSAPAQALADALRAIHLVGRIWTTVTVCLPRYRTWKPLLIPLAG